jgi:hypothetical protein
VRVPTQTDRVIKAARSFRGVCQADFFAGSVVDGGKPITRLAARIFDAEQQGHAFEIIGRRQGFKVYRLLDVERDTAPPVPPGKTAPSPSRCVSLSTDAQEGEPALFENAPESVPHWRQDAA